MGQNLDKRVAQLEAEHRSGGDWRQFGNDPRDMPDWALDMAIREEIKEFLKQAEESHPDSQLVADLRAILEAEAVGFSSMEELVLEATRVAQALSSESAPTASG